MAHETRAYALAAQPRSDADVAQIIILRLRRLEDRLGAEAANHYAPREDWTVESQNQECVRNGEAQYGATIERGARGSHPPADLGDTMSPPAELASTV